MGKLGKILSPIAAVLAIALAALSVLIYNGFQKYQKRAANLAETVEKTAKKLDAGTNTGLGSGKLSFADYKGDAGAFEKNTGNVVKLAGDVIGQRDELAEAIASMTQALGMPADTITADQLDAMESYQELLAIAKSYAEAFMKHDNELVKAIQDASKLVGAGNAANAAKRLPTIKETKAAASAEEGENAEEKTVKSAVYDSQEKQLSQLKTNIEAMVKRKAAYELAIKNLQKVFTAYKLKANVNGISGSGFEKILQDLAKDMMEINTKLKELDTIKNQLEEEKARVQAAEAKIKTLEAEKAELNEKLKAANDKLDYYGINNTDKPDLTDKSQVNPDTRGKVILDNKEWNYAIADLGKKKVVPGIEVIFADGTAYLASGIIKKVEEEICLIEITMRKAEDIPKGATVLIKGVQAEEGTN